MGGVDKLDACAELGWNLVARIKAARTQPVYWRAGPDDESHAIWDLITHPGQHWGGTVELYPSRGWRMGA